MKVKKNHIALLSVLLSLAASPAYAWDINRYAATAEESPEASFCGIKQDYQEGISLTFVKNTKGEMSLFFAFRDLTFPVPSNQLMSVIFKDEKNQLKPKMFQGDGVAIQEKLLRTSSFGTDVNLDLIGLYSHVEVVVANKVFTVPLMEDWRSASQKLKLCGSQIYIPPVRASAPAVAPVIETPVQPPAVTAQVNEQPILHLKYQEPASEQQPAPQIEAKIEAIPPVVPPEAVIPQPQPKKDYAFLKEVMAQSGLQSVEYEIVNDSLVKWKHGEMSGVYQEYNLAEQQGHSSEKLTRIAENTMFSLRQACAGAFVNEVSRMEHTTDKSFVRATAACSMKDKEVSKAILFVEAGQTAYVFIQEDNLKNAAALIEFRDSIFRIIQKSVNP